MSNIGKEYPSEMTAFRDPKTGREIIQLTASGSNRHLYFTDNSFYADDRSVLYVHQSSSLADPGEAELFRIDLETGIRTQLSDFEGQGIINPGAITKTPDGQIITFTSQGKLYAMFPGTGEIRLLASCPVGYIFAQATISHDAKYVAVIANQAVPQKRKIRADENYNGFLDTFYAIKTSKIILAQMDGSGAQTVFEDTHWMGHIQFAPDTNEYLTFCHEGPWNYVQQRIWLFNTITRHAYPCFVQGQNDSVGHEFWTRDGLVFFDNRGRGHDGTITSDKSQAVTVDYDGPDDIPEVGFADKNGKVVRTLQLPYYCNHYHANKDNTLLVADAVNDLVLIDISTDTAKLEVLCEHNTSWRWQGVHCHPTWSWSNNAILYRSDGLREGYPQLYLIRM